jgi:hypothetical protein
MSASRNLEPLNDLIDSGDHLGVAAVEQAFDDAHAVQDCRVVAVADPAANEDEAAPGRFVGDVHRDLPSAGQRLRPAVGDEIAQGRTKVIGRHLQDAADGDPAWYGRRLFGESAKSSGAVTFSVGRKDRRRRRLRLGRMGLEHWRADHPRLERLCAESPHMSGLCPYVSRGRAWDSDHTD